MDNLPTISSHLPDMVGNYIAVRAERLALDKQAADLKEQEELLKKVIIDKLREGGMTAMGAPNGIVKLGEDTEPICNDWHAFYAYVKEHDAWELLHKRVTISAVKERWNDGVEIPGVTSIVKYKLTVSKA